ncbi:predicted protein [Lichtheimia corymbifera JMRC:FSU:9682]|uniref:Uncharacterized protein n=1 Tax=Lichtheimia corymbifera JMRC:FSU:9682 TaxID=1263082 RepID=A0A068RTY7_9FUNG|nr:predicted protein [Lichtheimia corymbifera JMRC:FSU:9682]
MRNNTRVISQKRPSILPCSIIESVLSTIVQYGSRINTHAVKGTYHDCLEPLIGFLPTKDFKCSRRYSKHAGI